MTGIAANEISVGIIANPASGGGIQRLISAASGFTIAEKTTIVRRLCLGMQVTGVKRVYLMPDRSGLSGSVLRSKDQGKKVLGGHSTHRLVTNNCGNTSMVALSTGTNKVIPHFQKATVAGMAYPVPRDSSHGLRLKFCPPGQGMRWQRGVK